MHDVTAKTRQQTEAKHPSGEDVNLTSQESMSSSRHTISQTAQAPDLLRFLKVQILAYASAWRSSTEHHKIAMSRNRSTASMHALFHTLPLFAAIVLIALNWRQYFLGSGFTSSTALQFAAKFHELLMQASLGEILLCVVRNLMVKGNIPLGGLSVAMKTYQISFLWSLEFIASIKSHAYRGWPKAIFITTTISLLALINTVGPSAAVLMIPRPNILGSIGSTTFYGPRYEFLMPSRVDSTYDFTIEWNISTDGFRFYHDTNQKGTTSQTYTDTHDSEIQRQLYYMTSSRQAFPNESIYLTYDYYSAIATLPTQIAVQTLQYVAGGTVRGTNYTVSSRSPHPVVVARCIPRLDVKKYLTGNFSLPYLKDSGTTQGALPTHSDLLLHKIGATKLAELRTDAVPPVWIRSPETDSSSIIGVLPTWNPHCPSDFVAIPFMDLFTKRLNASSCFDVKVCTISAFWASSNIELLYNDGTWTARSPPLVDVGFNSPRLYYNQPIELDLDNIPSINRPNIFFQSAGPPEPRIAAMFATTIAQVPETSSSRWYYSSYENRSTPYLFDFKQYGFGYNTSSTSVKLALAVLLTYCIVIMGYLAYILITGNTSTAWNSATEIVMLALNSQAPENMGHTSVGINSIKTYEKAVGIRVNDNNELQLTFAGDGDAGSSNLRRIVPNEEY